MWSIMDLLLILAGCSILAPSVFGQSEETQIILELSTASVMEQITERIYMMVTDGSEHIIAPTPTTLSFHHTPKSHPLPIFVIPSLSTDRFIHYDTITSVAPFEGHTNSPPVTIITSETVSTVSQKSDVMSDKMGSTELKTETTPTTTRCHESSSRPVTTVTVPGSSAVTQPGGGGPPYGPPTRPPIASPADHSNIYISVSVIVIVLIIVSGIGIVSLMLVHKYRAAKRRVSDAMGMDLKKRRNTPWHLYYAEPVPGHNH